MVQEAEVVKHMSENLDKIIESQAVIKTLEVELDKNGKLVSKRTNAQVVNEFIMETGEVDPAGAQDAEIIQIEVAAGEILEIYHVSLASETGSKPVGIGTSTAAVFADPFSGMAGAVLLWAGMAAAAGSVITNNASKPILIVDNSGGSASLYLYVFAYDAWLDVVQVNTEKVGASVSGQLYTP